MRSYNGLLLLIILSLVSALPLKAQSSWSIEDFKRPANLNSVGFHNFEIIDSEPGTAVAWFDRAKAEAYFWQKDAQLIKAQTLNITPEGESDWWVYTFYSRVANSFNGYRVFSDSITPFAIEYDEEDKPDTTALPHNWINSDTATKIAEANGGENFKKCFADYKIYTSLHFIRNDGTILFKPQALAGLPHDLARLFEQNQTRLAATKPEKQNSDYSSRTIWFFLYYSEARFEFFEIAINALTGVVLDKPVFIHTAKEKQQFTDRIAGNWAEDARVVSVASPNILANGRSSDWVFNYFSAEKDSVMQITTFDGVYYRMEIQKAKPGSCEVISENWIDSSTVIEVAATEVKDLNLNTLREPVSVKLSRNSNRESRPVWCVTVIFPTEDTISVDIDAVNGALITGINKNKTPETPVQFVLAQNYPNPFNPETVIRYELPETGQVEMAVYNAIGQLVRILINATQPAGVYQVAWDGREDTGQIVASGFYYYRLRTNSGTVTRKMILLH